jgi:methylated-DNA-[protein]-cysteine S-methyltransferase
VDHAIRSMQRHLAGQPQHLRELPLRMQGLGAFEQQVYTEARRLDPGQTCSYGELARRIGQASAARAVGAALGANPWPLIVPCHRVLAAGGKLGGFSAPGGVEAKRVLLLLESEMVPRAGDWFG